MMIAIDIASEPDHSSLLSQSQGTAFALFWWRESLLKCLIGESNHFSINGRFQRSLVSLLNRTLPFAEVESCRDVNYG